MDASDEVSDFLARLRQLRAGAGSPSFRTMAKTSGIVSHSALHEAVTGSRLPTWPVVREFVKACDGDETQWRQAWARASNPAGGTNHSAQPTSGEAVQPVEQTSDTIDPRPSAPARRRSWLGMAVATHGAMLLAGIAIGAVIAGYAIGGPAPAGAAAGNGQIHTAVECRNALSDDGVQMSPASYTARTTKSATASATSGQPQRPPTWVGRVGSQAQILTGAGATVPVTQNVAAGDALVVSIMLTSTCPAPLAVTDSRGNQYQPIADVLDTRHHRVVILAAFDVTALSTADQLQVTYITASKYHIAVDEYRNIHTAVAHATDHGEAGGTTFGIAAPATCQPGQLLIGAVGSNTGTAPILAPTWTALPTLRLSSYRLTTGYQLIHKPGPCTLTGSTTSQWGAALAVLR